ncbi:hypothetical protein LTR37_002214 [Vermiconidia calcicola]|uniref:Uncharacterized protein n=1 Tax=Vermiconidia calcicola TaxID=1690605 RepID=A0ACC3NUT9_9PEZI|nr:hypothetical protein LTR37_002214 [Vermiconidia calcicola]
MRRPRPEDLQNNAHAEWMTGPREQPVPVKATSMAQALRNGQLKCLSEPVIVSKDLESPRVTRTHKGNDRDHVGLANGTAAPEEHLPRYFAKSGYAGENPSNTKKQGSGKGNWGREGVSELEDYDFNTSKPRRRTNSSTHAAGHSGLKTKFEAIDPEVIEYDEETHGVGEQELEKMSTASSAESVEVEDAAKKNSVDGVEEKMVEMGKGL